VSASDAGERARRYAGRCLCGAVRYVATGAPVNVRICHCDLCKRVSGSAFYARALFPKTAVAIEGEIARVHSSPDLERLFCPRCGSPLFAARHSKPQWIAITLGSLDDPSGLPPTDHIWTSRKVAWLHLNDGLPQYPEMPG